MQAFFVVLQMVLYTDYSVSNPGSISFLYDSSVLQCIKKLHPHMKIQFSKVLKTNRLHSINHSIEGTARTHNLRTNRLTWIKIPF